MGVRPTASAGQTLEVLVAAGDGAVRSLARRHGVRLIVVFGSAVEPGRQPADLDLAVDHDGDIDLLALGEDLYRLTGYERVDILDLPRAGIVARAKALGRGRLLFEREPGRLAEAQMVALALLWDTRWLRDLELDVLAG